MNVKLNSIYLYYKHVTVKVNSKKYKMKEDDNKTKLQHQNYVSQLAMSILT